MFPPLLTGRVPSTWSRRMEDGKYCLSWQRRSRPSTSTRSRSRRTRRRRRGSTASRTRRISRISSWHQTGDLILYPFFFILKDHLVNINSSRYNKIKYLTTFYVITQFNLTFQGCQMIRKIYILSLLAQSDETCCYWIETVILSTNQMLKLELTIHSLYAVHTLPLISLYVISSNIF